MVRPGGERASSTRHFYFIIPNISPIFPLFFTYSHIYIFTYSYFLYLYPHFISLLSHFSPQKNLHTFFSPPHLNTYKSQTHLTIYTQNLSTIPRKLIHIKFSNKNLSRFPIPKKLSTFLISQPKFQHLIIFTYVI